MEQHKELALAQTDNRSTGASEGPGESYSMLEFSGHNSSRKRIVRQMDYDLVDYNQQHQQQQQSMLRQQRPNCGGSLSRASGGHLQLDDRSTHSFGRGNPSDTYTQSAGKGFSDFRSASEIPQDRRSRAGGDTLSMSAALGDNLSMAMSHGGEQSFNRGTPPPSLSAGTSSIQRQQEPNLQPVIMQPRQRQEPPRRQVVPQSFNDPRAQPQSNPSGGFMSNANNGAQFSSESLQQQQQMPQQQQQRQPKQQRPQAQEGMGISAGGSGLPGLPSNYVRLISGKCGTLETEWEDLQCILIKMFRPQALQQQASAPQAQKPKAKQLHSDGVSNICRRSYRCTQNSDGYRWLKYGQKLLTNSQLYREYFRCAHPCCPAKKHVEVEPSTGKIMSASNTPHNHSAPAIESPAPLKKARKTLGQPMDNYKATSPRGDANGERFEANDTTSITMQQADKPDNNKSS